MRSSARPADPGGPARSSPRTSPSCSRRRRLARTRRSSQADDPARYQRRRCHGRAELPGDLRRADGHALGLEQAGFAHQGVIDLDADACQTLRRNRAAQWTIIQADLAEVDGRAFRHVDLLSGACPARRSPSPESSSASTTSGTCSRRRSGSSSKPARARCCWRTCPPRRPPVRRLPRPAADPARPRHPASVHALATGPPGYFGTVGASQAARS